ncbi:MAG: hypothetical protein E7661_06160 [Ruminococcaceae bacterium]|nr:hypothetical protein [Oscillospiraceae bacterium]
MRKISKHVRGEAILGGALLLLISFSVKCATISPYVLLHRTETLIILPPLWIMGFFWFLAYFFLGSAGGHLLFLQVSSSELRVSKYKGGMFYILWLVLSYVWYVLLFTCEAFLVSWIILALALCCAGVTIFSWLSLSKGCAVVLVGVFLGHLLLFLLQMAAMLSI